MWSGHAGLVCHTGSVPKKTKSHGYPYQSACCLKDSKDSMRATHVGVDKETHISVAFEAEELAFIAN